MDNIMDMENYILKYNFINPEIRIINYYLKEFLKMENIMDMEYYITLIKNMIYIFYIMKEILKMDFLKEKD